jgi:hypothetical protein
VFQSPFNGNAHIHYSHMVRQVFGDFFLEFYVPALLLQLALSFFAEDEKVIGTDFRLYGIEVPALDQFAETFLRHVQADVPKVPPMDLGGVEDLASGYGAEDLSIPASEFGHSRAPGVSLSVRMHNTGISSVS